MGFLRYSIRVTDFCPDTRPLAGRNGSMRMHAGPSQLDAGTRPLPEVLVPAEDAGVTKNTAAPGTRAVPGSLHSPEHSCRVTA
jgi:hypothetical protein